MSIASEGPIDKSTVAQHLAKGCLCCKKPLTADTALVVVAEYWLTGFPQSKTHLPGLICRECYLANRGKS